MNEPCKIVIPALKKSYNEKTVLDTSAIELSYGRIYAIIGANGSGKSTLAKVIAGTVQPDGGSRLSLNCNARYMPQKTYAYNMSLKRNILLGGKDYKRLQHLSAKMGIDKLLKNNSSKLSGGETAKMSLCAVIMSPCKLLLLDEPTAAMDMASTLAAEELIEEWTRQTCCATVLISHSLSQAQRLADEIIFMHEGRIIESGSAHEVLDHPKDERLKSFLDFYR